VRTRIDEYSSVEMGLIWSADYRIRLERDLWVLVMELQRKAGVEIPEEAIEEYRVASAATSPNDVIQIEKIEQVTKHDLQARLNFFNKQVGHSFAHLGLTSCDITENALLLQIRNSIELLVSHTRKVLSLLSEHIKATRDVVCVARTHNQPAQATLLGKRFATVADEVLCGLGNLELAYNSLPCRGLIGAVGTGQDLITLLGSKEAYETLNADFIEELGFRTYKESQGQIYSRSEDLNWVSAVQSVVSGCVNLARVVRLESGHSRMWESFGGGQVGSSAMPHKRNPIISERICGLGVVLHGFQTMVSNLAGQQWYEGDVSDSVTRRVALPGVFHTADAVLENTSRLLQGLDLDKDGYRAEVNKHRADILTSTVLMEALKNGADRDQAYRAIQEYAAGYLWEDIPGLDRRQVLAIWGSLIELPGAQSQIDEVLTMIREAISDADRSQ
jgi:adenylosuccinate lyase